MAATRMPIGDATSAFSPGGRNDDSTRRARLSPRNHAANFETISKDRRTIPHHDTRTCSIRTGTDDRHHMNALDGIRLVGPGGAGKSTVGALLAERLEVVFLDLDRHLAEQVGDISAYIGLHGYERYARENVEVYRSLSLGRIYPGVVALSSGFMTYAHDVHSEYSRIRRDLEQHGSTFVLLPSLDRDLCIAETVRRQIARPFGRSPAEEEAVIRARFDTYMAVPARKVETMRPAAAVVEEIVATIRKH
jgi:shikimate kinase